MTVVRVKASGQVLEMVPRAARVLIDSGRGEEVTDEKVIENALAVDRGPAQMAVKPPQGTKTQKLKDLVAGRNRRRKRA